MTPFELDRAEEISSALSFYYIKFTEYLSVAISLTEALPEEINNQIRDAFTHLSRANASESIEEVKQECKLAIGHIERANRDCLKASIITARAQLEDLRKDAMFHYGFLTPAIGEAHKALVRARKTAYQLETQGDGGLTSKLETILRETLDLGDVIREHYVEVGTKKTRFTRRLMSWFRPVSYVLMLLIGTALGTAFKGELQIAISWFLSLFGR